MKVEYIFNTGKDTVSALIKSRSKTCTKLYIAVGFITTAGLEEIINSLRTASSRGIVNVLTGLYLGVTEPAALKIFLKLESQKGKRFQSFIYKVKDEFHKKVYLFVEGKRFYAIVGSSNITSIGLSNEGEANVYIKGNLNSKADSNFYKDLIKDFSIERNEKLSSQIIKDYESQRTQFAETINRKIRIDIKKILKSEKIRAAKSNSNSNIKSQLSSPNFYIDKIEGHVNKKTEYIIDEEINWERFQWYAIRHKANFKLNDIIYLIDHNNNRFYPVNFKDYCRTKNSTPDGKYFAAYLPQKKFKKLNKNLRGALVEIGIAESNLSKFKKLTLRQANEIGKMFK